MERRGREQEREPATTQFETGSGTDVDEIRAPGLTLLYHPDLSRLGERAVLTRLASGEHEPLSRLEPLFSPPLDAAGSPLDDPRISRSPLWLRPGKTQGAVLLCARESRTRVVADGQTVDSERELSADAIRRGVLLVLGGQVLLLLHEIDPGARPGLPRFGLIGESPAMMRVREEIRRVASLSIPVLLRGETGTGKELVARAIHEAGPRRSGPFVTMNLAAVPPSLAAAELFGSTRGAFTGADRPRTGYLSRAQGGSVFLDEIGEAPRDVQVLLLRALETGEIQPVGAERQQHVDVRVISATDADLEQAMQEGRFSIALLHRLGGYVIRLPPLRERREDFGRLLVHFLREELDAMGETRRLEPAYRPWLPTVLVAQMAAYTWPGNLRQLRNVVRQLVIAHGTRDEISSSEQITHLFAGGPPGSGSSGVANQPSPASSAARSRKPADVQEEELLAALRANRWNLQTTANQLGIPRSSLYDMIERSSRLRKASDLSEREIRKCFEEFSGDLAAMAGALEVSAGGLRRRIAQLGLSRSAPRRNDPDQPS